MAAIVVTGRVVDPAGSPVVGARVLVSASPVPVPDIAQLTGSDGGFAMAAPVPGAYRIAVHACGWAPAEVAVDISLLTNPPVLEIVMRREE